MKTIWKDEGEGRPPAVEHAGGGGGGADTSEHCVKLSNIPYSGDIITQSTGKVTPGLGGMKKLPSTTELLARVGKRRKVIGIWKCEVCEGLTK